MVQVEALMLANHAEALNGLLYVHGAGWSHHWRGPGVPGQARPPSQLGIGAIFRFEESEVGHRLPLALRIVSSDTEQDVLRIDGELMIAPGGGQLMRSCFAANVSFTFPAEGRYELVCEIPEHASSVVEFWVHDAVPEPGDAGRAPETTPSPGYI